MTPTPTHTPDRENLITSIQYPISLTYANWGEYDIVREILSNAYDCDKQFVVNYYENTKTLEVINNGTIPLEGFLIGNSIKDNPKNSIGKFGEGLKISLLTALRLQIGITIESGDYIAIPSISNMLNTDVLEINFYKKEYTTSTKITISPISFLEHANNFLFLKNREIDYTINFIHNHSMKVFVKGVLLPNTDKTIFGYNLSLDLSDRDRTSSHEYKSEIQSLLSRLFKKDNLTEFEKDIILKILHNNDSTNLEYSLTFFSYISGYVKSFIYNIFGYPEKTLISSNPKSDKLAEWMKYKLLKIENPFAKSILENIYKYSSTLSVNDKMTIITAHKLNDTEKSNLKIARKLCQKVNFNHKNLIIFENENQPFVGLYKPENHTIYIRKDVLSNTISTIDTVIHELAHWYSGAGDLTPSHAHALTYVSALILSDYVKH